MGNSVFVAMYINQSGGCHIVAVRKSLEGAQQALRDVSIGTLSDFEHVVMPVEFLEFWRAEPVGYPMDRQHGYFVHVKHLGD